MICASIKNKKLLEIYDILDRPDVEMAEIRLDLCPLDEVEREELFSTTDKPLIATCRIGGGISAAEAEQRLLEAIEDGATYIDLEMEAPVQMSRNITRACHENGISLIRSYHNFVRTPDTEELEDICEKAARWGANLIKVATLATSEDDFEKIRPIYDELAEGSFVGFCMGEAGRRSRLECLAMGAPFTYATPEGEQATAPGQWSLSEINARLYGERKRLTLKDLEMPASKSFAQRAIVAAALAEGTSRLHGYSPCGDSEAALDAARSLGAEVRVDGRDISIKGIGAANLGDPSDEAEAEGGAAAATAARKATTAVKLRPGSISAGESGLLARLLIPVLSQIAATPLRVEGRGTLLRRPLADATDIMASFGVMLTNAEPQAGREVKIPVRLEGSLMPGRADISGRGGSQLISGLLMALPLASGRSSVYIHEPKSIPYMFITVDVLKQFGIKIGSELEGGEDFIETRDWSLCSDVNFHIKGGQKYLAAELDLEQDWSSAAVFCVAGALLGEVSLYGLDAKSLQADLSILDILAEAGACVSEDEDGTINVFKAPLAAFETDLGNAPDLFPIVAVLAAFCAGESRITGLGRLVSKESNRSQGILDMLTQMGVEAFREGDCLIVRGHSMARRLLEGSLLRGGEYSSHHDHRMVMALTVASLCADSPIMIDDTDCVSKSFPDFFSIFGV